MHTETASDSVRTSPYLRVALVMAGILLVPLVAMQFTEEVNWNLADFLVMGALLFGFGSSFLWVSARLGRSGRLWAGLGLLALFLLIWAELAVGVFTDLGS